MEDMCINETKVQKFCEDMSLDQLLEIAENLAHLHAWSLKNSDRKNFIQYCKDSLQYCVKCVIQRVAILKGVIQRNLFVYWGNMRVDNSGIITTSF